MDDAATRVLMTRFYGELLNPDTRGDAALAMQRAMVSMIKENKEEAGGGGFTLMQWAAFVVFGLC